MARTTSEAEGADEADYVDPGLDRPSQAEGDVGDSSAPEDVPDDTSAPGGSTGTDESTANDDSTGA